MSRGRSGKRGRPDDGWGGVGGYMKAKAMKLDHQFEEDAPRSKQQAGTSSSIFEGVSIHVNGYTDPPAEKLKKLMMTHGGRYIYYPNKTNTTHIIASNLAYTKIKELKKEKVVTPNWIMDSIKAGKLLPHAPYLLYRPKASNQTIHRYAAGSVPSEDLDIITDQRIVTPVTENDAGGSNLCAPSTGDHEDVGGTVEKDGRNVDHDISTAGGHETSHSVATSAVIDESKKDTPNERPTGAIIQDSKKDSSAELDCSTAVLPSGNSSKAPLNQSGGAFPKSGDPSFLSEFYSNSRLHHISLWGAEYKAFVNELQRTGDRSFPGRAKLGGLVEAKDGSRKDLQQVQSDDGEEFEEKLTSFADVSTSKVRGHNEDEERVIMHIDMDCFFVSVSLLNHPELKGKPVAVTHSKGNDAPDTNKESREFERAYYEKKRGSGVDLPGRGGEDVKSNKEHDSEETRSMGQVGDQSKTDSRMGCNSLAEIASCSYEARAAGVKNGMFMGRARELCPELKTVQYDFEGYQRVSRCLYETVASYTHDIEAVSCDEMLVDITSIMAETGAAPLEVARILRKEVYAKTQCHASTGLASNILLARLSMRKAKPDGMFFLKAGCVESFMKDVTVRDLPGVGWSTNKKLQEMGIITCGDLQNVTLGVLQKEFGPKTGQQLYAHCRGQDDRPIRMERERKSVSAEVNYGIRFKGEDEALKFISDLAAEVHKRLHGLYMVGRTITLKLKVRQAGAPKETSKFMGHGVCDDKARSVTLGQETDDLSVIQRESRGLFLQIRALPEDVRGVGIQISRLKSKSSQPTASKSLVDMLPRKADMAKTAPPRTTDGSGKIQKPQGGNSKPGNTSLLDFVQKGEKKSSRTSPSKIASLAERTNSPVKEPPALPRLPTLNSPPSNEKPRFRGVVTPRVPPTRGVGYSLPSPSQLDMSVLNSLPEDLKKQILKEYKQSGALKKHPPQRVDPDQASTSTGATSSHDIITPGANQAGTSTGVTSSLDQDVLQHLPPEILQEVLENERIQRAPSRKVIPTLGPVAELPSFSQIDPSCLEALPEDMRREITSAYQRRLPKSRTSPSKLPSPFKIARRKGRPKKGSPNKLPWQRNILEAMNISPSKQDMGVTASRRLDSVEGVGHRLGGVTAEASGDTRIEQRGADMADEGLGEVAGGVPRNEDTANLAGAVKLKEVKDLLREWTSTFKNPLEDDIGIVVQYLRELILERNLEMVHLVLRGLKRIVRQSESRQWMDACKTITHQVQNTVQQFYGSTLKL